MRAKLVLAALLRIGRRVSRNTAAYAPRTCEAAHIERARRADAPARRSRATRWARVGTMGHSPQRIDREVLDGSRSRCRGPRSPLRSRHSGRRRQDLGSNKHYPVRITRRPRPRGARMTPSASTAKSANERDDSGKTRSIPFVVLGFDKVYLQPAVKRTSATLSNPC